MSYQWKAPAEKVVVAVERVANETTTEAGIVVPQVRKSRLATGQVLAAGPDASNVQVGDKVLFLNEGAVEVNPGIVSMDVNYVMAIHRPTDSD